MSNAKKEEQIDIEEQISRLEISDDLINKALQGGDDAGAAEAKKALAKRNSKTMHMTARVELGTLEQMREIAFELSTPYKRIGVNNILNLFLKYALENGGKEFAEETYKKKK